MRKFDYYIYARTYEEEMKFLEKYQRQCKCGRKRILLPDMDRIICDCCGYWIYKDNRTRFKYEMKSRLIKNKQLISEN